MKKLVISALCGLCLVGAFVCASQPADSANQTVNEVALSKRGAVIRM